MNSDHHHTSTWLLESQLEPYLDAFMLHLFDCRYTSYAAARLLIWGLMTLTGRPRLSHYEEPRGDVKMSCRYRRQPVTPLPIT